jgi:NitT/TauT family transport system substrate-binding protein
MTQTLNRRSFLRSSGLFGLGLATAGMAAPYVARAAEARLRIASNPGLENATLNALMGQQGYLKQFGVDVRVVEAAGVAGPFDAIAAGEADVCMVSGYNMVLPRIAQGARLKIVGAGMRKTALAVFAQPGVKTLADLQGRTVAVGPSMGLLHALMLQLMRERGLDAAQVRFVDKGGNDECYQAVVRGDAEACCTSISHLNDQDGLVLVAGGKLWETLPKYVFQTAYASDTAIQDKHPELVAAMAAYGRLYDYLMSPGAHGAFFEARKQAQKKYDAASAQAVWDFNQTQRPYSRDLSLAEADIAYLQDMFSGLGSLRQKQAMSTVADMSAAKAAAKLLA